MCVYSIGRGERAWWMCGQGREGVRVHEAPGGSVQQRPLRTDFRSLTPGRVRGRGDGKPARGAKACVACRGVRRAACRAGGRAALGASWDRCQHRILAPLRRHRRRQR